MPSLDRLLAALSTALAIAVAGLLIAANWPTSSTGATAAAAPDQINVPAPALPEARTSAEGRESPVRQAPVLSETTALSEVVEVDVGGAGETHQIPEVVLPAIVEPMSVPNHPQERNLNCEFRSAADLAAYYGFHFKWETLFLAVGHDPNGDPDVGFVGQSINDPPGGTYPAGYGVHARPIAQGLRRLNVHATAVEGLGTDWLRIQLAAGRPVIIWATAGLMSSRVVEWETKDGRMVQGVPSQHTFTAIGYDEQGLWLNDPWDGSTKYYSWERFERAWALLDQEAVVIDPTRP